MTKKKRKKTGLPPGSVVFTGDQKAEQAHLHYLQFDETTLKESTFDSSHRHEIHKPIDAFVQWYDLRGLHDTELIEAIGQQFRVHPLALEDIADTNQRPKFDEYEDGIFITLKALGFKQETQEVTFEQVALYLGPGFVLSFQEKADDLFPVIRSRIEKAGGRVRKRQADYLFYTLMDYVVDHYYNVLDEIEEVITQLEERISTDFDQQNRSQIYQLKQEMHVIRKAVIPVRDLVGDLLNAENELIEERTEPYLRDLRDHVIQVIDLIETYRENLNSLQDLYLSELSYKMNRVMQVLTIVATIFIPLTFLAGIYGMNFKYMPELGWRYGYFGLLGIMAVVFLLMLWYFRRQRWL